MIRVENSTVYVGPANVRNDERAVDAWVRQDLLRKYDRLLSEPVPLELIALLPRP